MGQSETIDIGEGAGDFRIVERVAYEKVYAGLSVMLAAGGEEEVLEYRKKCAAGELDVSSLVGAIVLTVIGERDGKFHLRTSDEADLTPRLA